MLTLLIPVDGSDCSVHAVEHEIMLAREHGPVSIRTRRLASSPAQPPGFSGIIGIAAYAGRDERVIIGILKNGTHRFDTVMPPALLQRIARFVRDGQVDASNRIDPVSNPPGIQRSTQGASGHLRRSRRSTHALPPASRSRSALRSWYCSGVISPFARRR